MIRYMVSVFAVSIFMPIYTYLLYPFILKCFPDKKHDIDEEYRPMVSIIIAAYNEEKNIYERIKNLLNSDYPKDKYEILIGSDGSTDATYKIAKGIAEKFSEVRVFEFQRGGKVSVLNQLIQKAKGEIFIFSDANTEFDLYAIKRLVRHFRDQSVGCVSGQVRLHVNLKSGHGAKSESAYWKYENWVKKQESRIGKLSGANGAIYGVRGSLLEKIPDGIINDDFFVGTYIAQQGYDVLMETEAIAYEIPNDDIEEQFRRHIRDGAGHYQALQFFWRMLLPRKGSFVYVSHRVIKWLVPFGLILAFISNMFLCGYKKMYRVLFVIQIAGYSFFLGYYFFFVKSDKQIKGTLGKAISIVFYFLSVNIALLKGFLNYVTGKQKAVWETMR